MKYRITHTTKYTYSNAVPVCHNLVHLEPRTLPYQTCDLFRLMIYPEPFNVSDRKDYFGNHVSYFSIDQAHRGLTVTAKDHVEVTNHVNPEPGDGPSWETVASALRENHTAESLDAFQFLAKSPSIKPFPQLAEYAKKSFSQDRPILEAVVELAARIHEDFTYDPRATTVHTPIEEVFENRHGVCQDFAHLQIGCLRSMGLSARYVSGYLRTLPPPGKPRLVGVDASHAWLSVYCGNVGWVDIDPTNNILTSTDHVTVAWGRDYSDVCPIQGVIVGGGDHQMTVSVDVAPDDDIAK